MVYNVACRLQISTDAMRDQDWRGLDDEALGRLLVERWLYRGLLLGAILLAAIVVTYLGARGLQGLADYVTVVIAVGVGLVAAALAFAMRVQDLKIHRELRQRRRPAPPAG
jgi:hypothetical protein